MTKRDLDDLKRRLDTARRRRAKRERAGRAANPYGFGLRLVTDLGVGLIAGFLLGWLIDRFAGTTPLFIIIGSMLGLAGGIRNVMLAASSREAQRHLEAIATRMPTDAAPEAGDDDDDDDRGAPFRQNAC